MLISVMNSSSETLFSIFVTFSSTDSLANLRFLPETMCCIVFPESQ